MTRRPPTLTYEGDKVVGKIADVVVFTISGLTSKEGVSVDGNTVTVTQNAASLAQKDVTITNETGSSYTLELDGGTTPSYAWTLNGKVAEYSKA